MKHTIKKYLTILLLLGLSCKVTACSNDKPFDETEIPPHLKPGEGEKPDVDYYPKNEGTTRLVSYNVGIFSKYTDSYQMVADMMTEAKADIVGISELDSCTVRTMRVFQLKKFAELMGQDLKDLKMITCHLGNGSSISAIVDGKVQDTSMGFTPLEGIIMGSRCGGVDPSAITYLQEKEGWTPAETAEILNKKSGVLGISGISSDDRDVLAAAEAGNKRAALARSIQRYQIRKFIGAYVAAMDGVDAIVFTGGIGENTCDLREDVCNHLTYLGVKIDCEKNLELRKGKEGELSTPDSKVRVFVLPTNEELLIARDTKAIVEKL